MTFHRLDVNTTRVTSQVEIAPEGVAENVADKTGVIRRRAKGDLNPGRGRGR